MAGRRRLSLRRFFHDYCELIRWSQSGMCPEPGCEAPASLSEYGTICLRGHVVDEQGAMPISRTADLAFAIVPAVRRDAGQTTDLQEALKRYQAPAAYEPRAAEELALLRELRSDVERWRENGGDGIDVGYILDTLDRLEAAYPHQEDDDPRDEIAEQPAATSKARARPSAAGLC